MILEAGLARYRKLPVEVTISAPITSDTAEAIAEWCGGTAHEWAAVPGVWTVRLRTLEGTMIGRSGWRIVQGTEGEFYPIAPAVFEAAYEPAPHETHETHETHEHVHAPWGYAGEHPVDP